MSIIDWEKEDGISGFDMECDTCGQAQFFNRTYFIDMIVDAKASGWHMFKDDKNEWVHVCPSCRQASDAAQK